jgi:hypothetical protein
MILPNFILSSRVDQHWEYSGLDSLEHCLDKKHFKSYPHKVYYNYNSRGFRDTEWPAEHLDQAIWCVGDSFTVGLGSPVEHTWVYQLGQQLNQRTINVSMDGASNQWISRKTIEIIKQVAPKIIVIQWSYLQRDELADDTLTDEDRRLHYDGNRKDFDQVEMSYAFVKLVQQVEFAKQNTRIIHSFVPKCGINNVVSDSWSRIGNSQIVIPNWPKCPRTFNEFNALDSDLVDKLITFFQMHPGHDTLKIYFELYNNIEFLPEIKKLDLARDGWHYDLLTAQQFATGVRELLNRNG